ncbi:MAG: efflux RND transporter periplasmic adaptor subunit [Emcibacteraceae bacterium]|nr:efflux RND transporter periplasmic adaptor subunit [Emcibacteraceae bacterium]
MNKSYKTAAIIVVGIILILASGVFFPSEDTDSASAATNTEATLMAVTVINPTSQAYEKDIVLRGYTESRRSVSLKSQVKGRIIDLPVDKGMRVNAGDVVCRIDVEDREANYAESVALVKQRQLEFAASEKLFAQGHRSETQHSAAKSGLDASLARSTRMKIDLENTTIKAPFNGVINDRPIEVGDYMKIGESCAMIVEEDPFLVVADISEKQISQARVGDIAHAILQNGRRLDGKIRYVSAVADKNTRTFRVELEVQNPNKDIRDGITAELFLRGDEMQAQKISAATLVLNDKGLVGVRVVDNNNRVQFNETEILGNHEDGIWISGLPSDVKIITEGHEFVKAGEIVNPILAVN